MKPLKSTLDMLGREVRAGLSERVNPVYLRLYPYWRKYLKLIVLSMMLSVLISAAGASFPWFLKEAVNALFIRNELSRLIPFMVALTALMAALNAVLFLRDYFSEKVRLDLSIHLRMQLLKSIFRKKVDFIKSRHSGEITSIMNNDLVLVENMPDLIIRLFFEFPIRMMALFATMYYLNPRLSLLTLIIAPPSYMVMKKVRNIRRSLSEKKMRIIARLFSNLQEFLHGIKVIKAWNLSQYCSRNFQREYSDYRIQSLNEVKCNSAVRGAMGLIIIVALNLVLYIAVREINASGATPGDYAGFVMALWLFLQPIKKIGMGYSNLINASVAAERVLELLDSRDAEESNLEEGLRIGSIHKIEISEAGFGFNDKEILEGVNMSFEPSKLYMITGHNGAGKSTIIESLIGFRQPSSGKVLLNGLPIDEYSLSSIRSRISFVWQDIFLFNGTVQENISFADRLDGIGSRRRYEQALSMAYVNELPAMHAGDDSSVLSEHGGNLSGGEKQCLCIARALFKEHDVLVLDEANSNISRDAFTGILDAICKSKEDKIIICVTHDPAYWNYGDVIYEVSDRTVKIRDRVKSRTP
jgi:subfamily B ATP-binding cassette protein MsbA